jgi:hypothetical protein
MERTKAQIVQELLDSGSITAEDAVILLKNTIVFKESYPSIPYIPYIPYQPTAPFIPYDDPLNPYRTTCDYKSLNISTNKDGTIAIN